MEDELIRSLATCLFWSIIINIMFLIGWFNRNYKIKIEPVGNSTKNP